MKAFWLKTAGLALIVVVVIVLVGKFTSSDSGLPTPPEAPKVQPKAEQRGFSDQVEDDKKRFLTKPQLARERMRARGQGRRIEGSGEPEAAVESAEDREQQGQQKLSGADKVSAKSAETKVLYFKPLSEIEEVEAERLLNVAVPGRSIGRLPVTGFSLMVGSCRQIISKWPDSWYAYRAKQMLADMPERFRSRYKITAQELDVSKFSEQRPGTEPFTVEDSP